MYNVGDIVKKRFDSREYYTVVYVYDFSDKVMYELSILYPVAIHSKTTMENHDSIYIVAENGTEKHSTMIEFINKERLAKGLGGIIVDNYSANINFADGLDIVNYDRLESIDECLDAMNDLKLLHNEFGDEDYLHLRELVQNRLKELV